MPTLVVETGSLDRNKAVLGASQVKGTIGVCQAPCHLTALGQGLQWNYKGKGLPRSQYCMRGILRPCGFDVTPYMPVATNRCNVQVYIVVWLGPS